MHFKTLKKVAKASLAFTLMVAAMATSSIEIQAQDLIARQAPIDRKMKAVDSIVINKAIIRHQKEMVYEESDLYSNLPWETKTVHCYGNATKPEYYKVDLRGFAMPTPSRVITSNFGYRASFGRMHKGIDVKVYIGDTISSAFDGKVRVVSYEGKGYGNYVVIRHNNGLETIYGHLSKHLCKVGDIVKAGQPIGLGGNTGRSTGSHLHFETRLLGEAINPALMFDFVHQDVTGDFYEYRRSGSALAKESKRKVAPAPEKIQTLPEVADVPSDAIDNRRQENNRAVQKEQKNQAVASAKSKKEKAKKETKSKSSSYMVKNGDTLYGIARAKGVTVQELCNRNKLSQNSIIHAGQTLKL